VGPDAAPDPFAGKQRVARAPETHAVAKDMAQRAAWVGKRRLAGVGAIEPGAVDAGGAN
jgi:hypothetical protein